MRVLVTGGAGFIGSNLVHALLLSGHEVGVIDDLSTGKPENLHPAAWMRTLDILDERFPGAVVEFAPEAVVHLARACFSRSPPAWLLGIRGYEFEGVDGLGSRARRNLDAAEAFVRRFLSTAVLGNPADVSLAMARQAADAS